MTRLLAVLPILLLSACNPPQQAPLRPLSDAELLPYYVAEPRQSLPEFTSFPLGERFVVEGTVQPWKATTPVPFGTFVKSTWVEDGKIQPDGQFRWSVVGSDQESLHNLLSIGYANAVGGLCPVDELRATSQVPVTLAHSLSIPVRALTAQVAPQTSPVPTEVPLRLNLDAYAAAGWLTSARLIYVDQDVTVTGEQRCITGYEQFSNIQVAQEDIRVNLVLGRGWNLLLRRYTRAGDVAEITWQALPADGTKRWTVNP